MRLGWNGNDNTSGREGGYSVTLQRHGYSGALGQMQLSFFCRGVRFESVNALQVLGANDPLMLSQVCRVVKLLTDHLVLITYHVWVFCFLNPI